MSLLPRARMALTVATSTLALFAAASAQAAQWTPAITVASNHYSDLLGQSITFAADGTAVRVSHFNPFNGAWQLTTSTMAAGTTSFGSPVEIGTIGTNQSHIAHATRADGSTAAAWMQYGRNETATDYDIVVADRAPSGAWSTPVVISNGASRSHSPRMTVTEDGTYVLVYTQEGPTPTLRVARKPVGGSWTVPAAVPGPLAYSAPAYANFVVGPDGELALPIYTQNRVLVYETSDGGVTWTSADLGIAVSDTTHHPNAAYDADGGLWVTWTDEGNGSTIDYQVSVRHRAAGQTWADAAAEQHVSEHLDLSNRSGASAPSIALDAEGNVHVAYVYRTSSNVETVRVVELRDGSWTGAYIITPNGSYQRTRAVTAANGDIVVTYTGYPAGVNTFHLYASVLADGDDWPATAPSEWSTILDGGTNLNQYGVNLRTDPVGGVIATWSENSTLRMAAYATGPNVRSVTVPATAKTNASIPVSAVATSLYGAAAPGVEWFVDGDPKTDDPVATTANASLTIAQPGTHFVYVTVHNAHGSTTRKHEVVVSLPPLPPDTDGDGIPNATDCAPDDRERPAHGGVADADCNGVDDAIDAKRKAEEDARIKALVDEAIKRAQEQAIKIAMQGFLLGASVAQKSIPASQPATSIQKQPIVFQANAPQTQITQISANLNGNNVIAAGGGNVIAAGGGNVIAAGGANVISAGGANVIAAGGMNLINANGVIAAGGGNVIAPGGANVIAAGGGNLVGRLNPFAKKPAKPKGKQVLLGGAAVKFEVPGKVKVKPTFTKQGKAIIAAYLKQAKALRKRGKKVAPLKLSVTTIVGPVEYGAQPATYSTKVITIKG